MLHAQDLVLIREHGSDFVKGIGSGISYLRMNLGNLLPLFQVPAAWPLALAGTLPAGKLALFPRKLALIFLEMMRIFDFRAIRERCKRFDAQVNSDLLIGRRSALE